MLEPDRTRFVALNRTRLRLWEWGDPDAPAVICTHGAHDHGRMFDGIAPRIAALGYQVVAPDLRGHGDSGRLSTGHVWAVSAIDLALLARSLGAPVGFVGHSFGGGQAMYTAAMWPELVKWVVNIDGLGPPGEAFAERPLTEMAQTGLANVDRVLAAPRRPYRTREEMVEHRRKINYRLPIEWVEHFVEHGTVETEGGWTWKSDPMFRVGLPASFDIAYLNAQHDLIGCPVLALTGDQHDAWSELSPADVLSRLRHIRDSRHQVIAGAGHYVHIEQPDAVMDAITGFLSSLCRFSCTTSVTRSPASSGPTRCPGFPWSRCRATAPRRRRWAATTNKRRRCSLRGPRSRVLWSRVRSSASAPTGGRHISSRSAGTRPPWSWSTGWAGRGSAQRSRPPGCATGSAASPTIPPRQARRPRGRSTHGCATG
jgi:pimeloyl-ACP methyl ester carboxylesterase